MHVSSSLTLFKNVFIVKAATGIIKLICIRRAIPEYYSLLENHFRYSIINLVSYLTSLKQIIQVLCNILLEKTHIMSLDAFEQ